MADSFSRKLPTPVVDIFKGCVLAIDGWVMQTRMPNSAEVNSPKDFYNRKGFYGVVVLAGCDGNCKFHSFSATSAGGTHDAIAYRTSKLASILENFELPSQWYVIGDDAFDVDNQLLTPYSGHGLGLWKDSFNDYLSSMRQSIERSFALLTQRWGIFWRRLRVEQGR